jgi:hypothetical protein
MQEERLPKLIMEWIPGERTKRGRPRKTWIEGVRAAMKTRRLEADQWLNRKEWCLGSGRRRQLPQDRKNRLNTEQFSGKVVLNIHWVPIFSRTFKTFLTLRIRRDTITNLWSYACKCPLFSPDFNETIFSKNSSKSPNIVLHEKSVQWQQSCLTQMVGRTKLSRFSQLCEPSQNRSLPALHSTRTRKWLMV